MIDFEFVRNKFPYLKTGKLYFNHAAISPLSTNVLEKINEYLLIRSETEIEPYFNTLDQATSAKDNLAKMLNVDSELISWSSNVSHSLNILAQGINWQKGDEIILNDLEFPSNVYPFLNLEKQGVKILFAKNKNGRVGLNEIEKLVTNNTKLISLSMVQFLSGYRADLKTIGNFCKEHNIIFCVDGIQGIGAFTIDLVDCKIDFFAGGTHKWLMAFQGNGYFYISDKLLEKLDVKHVGWTSVKNPWDLLNYDLNLLDNAERFQLGTLPRIGIIALAASLNFMLEVGFENMKRNILDNSQYLVSELEYLGFTPILSDVSREELSGIVTFPLKNAEEIYTKLKQKNVECSVREGMIRISPHFYNTKDELDILISNLKEVKA